MRRAGEFDPARNDGIAMSRQSTSETIEARKDTNFYRRLVLIGAPGSGKGTQGELLANLLGSPHISTGDLIRALSASGTPDGLRYKAMIDGGNFIPDEDMVEIVGRRLAEPDAERGYILDGFPRDLAQAELFDRAEAGRRLDWAVELAADESILIERIAGRLVCPSCGQSYHAALHPPKSEGVCDRDGAELVRRQDDEPEAVRRRLVVYHERTEPLLEHYRGQGKLLTVEASLPPDEVFGRLAQLLLRGAA